MATSWAERLIDEMAAEGYHLRPGDGVHEYVVDGFGERARAVPVLLRVDPVALERYIAEVSTSAEALYPGIDPLEAGYRLTTIHLDEELDATLPPMQEIWFEADAIRTVPAEGRVHPLPDLRPGDHSWATDRPQA